MGNNATSCSTFWRIVGGIRKKPKTSPAKNSRSTDSFFEELNTVVIQIESILNSGPLADMSNDPNDLQSITPAHFLLGRAASDIPNMTNNMDKNISLSQRFKPLERIKRSFWKSWHRDYLVTLQVRKRWLHSGPKFSEGDLVLIAMAIGEN